MSFYHQALRFGLVVHQLLFINPEYSNLWISIINNPLKAGDNIIPMPLGETLNGLDLFYEYPTHTFIGSPFFL